MKKPLLVLGGLIVLATVLFFAVKIGPHLVGGLDLWLEMSRTTVEEVSQREERVFELWKREVTGGAEPWELYPPREANAAALALEALAAELGIDCSTALHPAIPPGPAAAESWSGVGQTLKDYFLALRTSTAAEAPPLPGGLSNSTGGCSTVLSGPSRCSTRASARAVIPRTCLCFRVCSSSTMRRRFNTPSTDSSSRTR